MDLNWLFINLNRLLVMKNQFELKKRTENLTKNLSIPSCKIVQETFKTASKILSKSTCQDFSPDWTDLSSVSGDLGMKKAPLRLFEFSDCLLINPESPTKLKKIPRARSFRNWEKSTWEYLEYGSIHVRKLVFRTNLNDFFGCFSRRSTLVINNDFTTNLMAIKWVLIADSCTGSNYGIIGIIAQFRPAQKNNHTNNYGFLIRV